MKQLKLQLNDVLQKLLISSGWTFDRKIDLFKDEDFLKLLDEYLFFHSAREFLESFYKICINPSSNKTNNDFVRCKVYFDPNTALGESDRLEDWEAEVNEKLFPVGEFMYFFILISESGKFFLGETDIIHYFADNVSEGLRKLISHQDELWSHITYPK